VFEKVWGFIGKLIKHLNTHSPFRSLRSDSAFWEGGLMPPSLKKSSCAEDIGRAESYRSTQPAHFQLLSCIPFSVSISENDI
jgi:hypothetical protein